MSKMMTQQTQTNRKTGFRSGLTMIALLSISALTLAACALPPALPPAPPPRSPSTAAPVAPAAPAAPGANTLAGTSWVLASLGGNPPVENTVVTLNFNTDGNAGGNDGCNIYGAPYTVDGNALKFGVIFGTLIACEEPIMSQANAYRQALEQTSQFAIANDTLTLSDAGGKALATFSKQSTDLAGTNWIVTGYNNGNQAVVSPLVGTELTVAFGADGRVTGNAGCNNYFGPYTQEAGKIDIGPLASTLKACLDPAGVMDQEMQFLEALQQAATYNLDANTLDLRTADDALAVTMRRAP
jgi:heat shock protein HslJ